MHQNQLHNVASVWAYRKRVEFEAADLFARMAEGLSALNADENIIELARKSSEDEKRHAVLCQRVIDYTDSSVVTSTPKLGIDLGPKDLDFRKRILYTCVSVSCVTESLSTALLIEMRKLAAFPVIKDTVHEILEDEITHSRIGWAHLANEAKNSDVSWLAPYIPGMFREAMQGEPTGDDLSAWGILPFEMAEPIMLQTCSQVILPGLRQFDVIPN